MYSGGGKLALKILLYNKRDRLFDICALVDDNPDIEKEILGVPVFTFDECIKRFNPSEYKMFVAIGYTHCNTIREKVYNKVKAAGYKLANYISSKADVWEGTLCGDNIFVGDNSFIGHGCKLNDGCIIYENTTLCHDNEVGRFSFFSAEVAVGGDATIGSHCFLGLNSTIKSDVKVADYNIVGCSSNVIHSTPEKAVLVGNPAVAQVRDVLNVQI